MSDEEYDSGEEYGKNRSDSSDSQDESRVGVSGWVGVKEDFSVSLSTLLNPFMKQDMVIKYTGMVIEKMEEWKSINGFLSDHYIEVLEMEKIVLSNIKDVIKGWEEVANGKVIDIGEDDPRLNEFILAIDKTIGRNTEKDSSEDLPYNSESDKEGAKEPFNIRVTKLLTPYMNPENVKYQVLYYEKIMNKFIKDKELNEEQIAAKENKVISAIKKVVKTWVDRYSQERTIDIGDKNVREMKELEDAVTLGLSGGRKTKRRRKTKKRVRTGKRVRTTKTKRGIKSKRTRS